MTQTLVFQVGDRLRHADRPEWGTGLVDQAVIIPHEGGKAQKLTVRFEHKGRVAVHTGYARLVPEGQAASLLNNAPVRRSEAPIGSANWMASLENKPDREALLRLPEDVTDLFSSVGRRLRATLDLYRFSAEPRSLIDWAIAQTGLYDPLSEYGRHELEAAFNIYAQRRDVLLRELLRAVRKSGNDAIINELLRTADAPGRTALQRAIRSLQ